MSRKQKIALSTLVTCFAVMAIAITIVVVRGPKKPGAEKDGQQVAAAKAKAGSPEGEGVPDFFLGYEPNRVESDQFIQSLPHRDIRAAAPELFDDHQARGPPVLLYRALYAVQPGWTVGRQGIGDCVSWGFAHGADILLAVDFKLGRSGEWHSAATEAIYGGSRVEARGKTFAGYSDGSYGAAAAKWLRDWGIVYRQKYDTIDLSVYSAKLAKEWGAYGAGGKDDGGRLDAIAKSHPIRTIALVTSFVDAAAAIENGFPIPVCSDQGFSETRDSDGFAKPSGSWAHCMVFVGVRYEPRPGLLCLNSWGPNWIRGPPWPEDMPAGSFWVDAKVVDRMLGQRDSFALSNYEGFPRRPLKNAEGW